MTGQKAERQWRRGGSTSGILRRSDAVTGQKAERQWRPFLTRACPGLPRPAVTGQKAERQWRQHESEPGHRQSPVGGDWTESRKAMETIKVKGGGLHSRRGDWTESRKAMETSFYCCSHIFPRPAVTGQKAERQWRHNSSMHHVWWCRLAVTGQKAERQWRLSARYAVVSPR